jgi:ribonuclease HI
MVPCKGIPPKGGSGGILYLSSNHSIYFKAGIGQETNNYCELMALKLVLRLAQEFGVSQIQIFGDSLLVIQWMHKETTLGISLYNHCMMMYIFYLQLSHTSLCLTYTRIGT